MGVPHLPPAFAASRVLAVRAVVMEVVRSMPGLTPLRRGPRGVREEIEQLLHLCLSTQPVENGAFAPKAPHAQCTSSPSLNPRCHRQTFYVFITRMLQSPVALPADISAWLAGTVGRGLVGMSSNITFLGGRT